MKKQILIARAAATMVAVACPIASNADASAVEAGFSPGGRSGWRYFVPTGSEVFA